MHKLLTESYSIINNTELALFEKLQAVATLIQQKEPHYTWVGFYFMNNEAQSLHLGPFVGPATEHKTIAYGKGICGQVAVSGETYLADDVNQESNYIACSLSVQSEIVIPIFDDDSLVAQLDIDCSVLKAFDAERQSLLESLCYSIGQQLGSEMHYHDIHQDLPRLTASS